MFYPIGWHIFDAIFMAQDFKYCKEFLLFVVVVFGAINSGSQSISS